MIRRWNILLLSFLLHTSLVQAQEENASERGASYWTFSIHPSMNFNGNDFFLGLGAGMDELRDQWGFKLNFDFRPFFKKIQIDDAPGSISQYFEKKFFLSLDLEKRFLKIPMGTSKLRMFAGLKGGLLFGNYRGLRKAPQLDLGWSPVAGLALDIEDLGYLKLGYCYLDTKNLQIPNGRIYIGMTFLLNQQ